MSKETFTRLKRHGTKSVVLGMVLLSGCGAKETKTEPTISNKVMQQTVQSYGANILQFAATNPNQGINTGTTKNENREKASFLSFQVPTADKKGAYFFQIEEKFDEQDKPDPSQVGRVLISLMDPGMNVEYMYDIGEVTSKKGDTHWAISATEPINGPTVAEADRTFTNGNHIDKLNPPLTESVVATMNRNLIATLDQAARPNLAENYPVVPLG